VLVPGDAPGISFGEWTLTAAPGGSEAALRLLARAWESILVSLLLVASTPLPSILAALERWRLPRGFLEACALVYRYLWVLLAEGRRLLLARRLRGGRIPPWRSGGALIAALFARSIARANRIELALRLRGHRPGALIGGAQLRWTARDSARLCIGSAVLGVAILLPRLGAV
jgi:cobalt/nickel transport system permease protein